MEHRFEELLSEAIQMYGRVYIKIPAGKRRLHRFPEAFEEQIRDLFPEEHSIHPVRRRMPLRMLITVIIAAILAVSATALTVGAFRDAIIGFITEVYETFTNVQAEADTSAPDTLAEIYEVTWLPEGFVAVNEAQIGNEHAIWYSNGQDEILFRQSTLQNYSAYYDTELLDMESFFSEEDVGFLIVDEHTDILVWQNEYVFELIATFADSQDAENTLRSVMESVQIAESGK